MGQSASACCCCCLHDKRASIVRNESLKEKLLDEETNVTIATGDTPSNDSQRQTKHEATIIPMTQGLDLFVEEEEANAVRVSDGNGDDSGGEGDSTSRRTSMKLVSEQEETHAWNISPYDTLNSGSSRDVGSEDGDLDGSTSLRLQRIVSDASVRSARDDSYASTHEITDISEANATTYGSERTLRHATSSRVFEEDASSTSSRQAGDDDDGGFGSYGSESSSLRSFIVRESDESLASASQALDSLDATSSGKPPSPHRGKKKGKKSPRHKRR